MANESRKHILLSYSKESKAIVEMVRKKLREKNFAVCFDDRDKNDITHHEYVLFSTILQNYSVISSSDVLE